MLCVAPTGSGKTLAYVLPTLVALGDPVKREKGSKGGVRAVIMVPTHDLGVQIMGVAKAVTAGRGWRIMMLSKATERAVCLSSPGKKWEGQSGVEGKEVKESAEKGSGILGLDILIATPERLHHLVESEQLSLSR